MTADSDPVPPCRHSDYGECTPCQRDRVVSDLAKIAAHLFQRNGECRELMAQRDSHAAEIARLAVENGRLRAALSKYGNHRSQCLSYPGPCNCGFSQSLDSAGG